MIRACSTGHTESIHMDSFGGQGHTHAHAHAHRHTDTSNSNNQAVYLAPTWLKNLHKTF